MENINIENIVKPKKTRYEICKASIQRYQEKNREKLNEISKNYSRKRKIEDWEGIKKAIYKYRSKHKEEFNDYMCKYYKRKRLEKKLVKMLFEKLKTFMIKSTPKIIDFLKHAIVIIDESF